MKRLLLLVILLFSLASNATQIQIDFVSGFNINIINPTIISPNEGTATTDSAINTIFTNYNVNHCVVASYSNPYIIIFVDYYGSDVIGFRNALQNNSNVSKTWVCYPNQGYFNFADRLYLNLINTTNGNPIGTNNCTVVTTNADLNIIFTTYNVISMTQLMPSSRYYEIFFEGDITGLKNALDALTLVVDTTTDSTNLVGVAMLKNEEFNKSNTTIFPNPFSNSFSIQTDGSIYNYSLIEISGKQLTSTNSKNEIEKIASQLNSGVYFLNLQFENGQSGTFKLVKQ